MHLITPILFLANGQFETGRSATSKGLHGLALFKNNDDIDTFSKKNLVAAYRFDNDHDELAFRRDNETNGSPSLENDFFSKYEKFKLTDEKIKELTGESEFDSLITSLVAEVSSAVGKGFHEDRFDDAKSAVYQFLMSNKKDVMRLCQS